MSEGNGDDLFGPVIFKYTPDDAVRDGVLIPVGEMTYTHGPPTPLYFTSNLFADGYEDDMKRKELVYRGLDLLRKPDEQDSDYMRLRVIEEGRIWVILDGQGYTFMKPEDY